MIRLLTALALLFTVSQSSAQNIQAVFNTPKFTGAHTLTIENAIVGLIDKAIPGSSIHFSVYEWESTVISAAFLRASARGVRVKAVLDGGLKSEAKKPATAVGMLFSGSPQLGLAPLSCVSKECVKFCRSFIIGGSCRGRMNNHNKFILLSNLSDGRTNVIALTSANWNAGQWKNQNDLLILANDPVLFAATLNYWNGLMDSNVPVPLLLQGSRTSIYTFPSKKTDPILDLLNRTTCDLPGSKIRVMQSRFTDDRSAVAKRLADLAKSGCDVRVLTRDEPDMKSPGAKIKSILGTLQTIIRYKVANGPSYPTLHSKLVLIDARMDGSSSRIPIVLAGSHNLNGNSLTNNDELQARVTDRAALDQYMKFWEDTVVAARAAGIILQ